MSTLGTMSCTCNWDYTNVTYFCIYIQYYAYYVCTACCFLLHFASAALNTHHTVVVAVDHCVWIERDWSQLNSTNAAFVEMIYYILVLRSSSNFETTERLQRQSYQDHHLINELRTKHYRCRLCAGGRRCELMQQEDIDLVSGRIAFRGNWYQNIRVLTHRVLIRGGQNNAVVGEKRTRWRHGGHQQHG